jgi:hypothetical protein
MARERGRIFAWSGGAVLAALAGAGLVLLLLPGVARGLGGAGEHRPGRPTDEAVLFTPAGALLAEIETPPEQVEANRRRWAAMRAPGRRLMLERLGHLAELTAEERGLLVERYDELQMLPEKDRQTLRRQAEALARFEATLGRQDLAALEGLEGRAQAKYLAELWRERQGQR